MKNRQGDQSPEKKKPVWADDGPPAGAGRDFEVLHPTIGRPVQGILLGDDIAGVMLHWLGDVSFPCVEGYCGRPHTARDPYWHGYTPLAVRGAVVPTILGVSAAAWKQLAALSDAHDGLRGLHVRLSRTTGQRSRVVVQLLTEDKVTRLSPTYDPRPYLLQMWFPELAEQQRQQQPSPAESEQRGRLARVLDGLFTLNGHTQGGDH